MERGRCDRRLNSCDDEREIAFNIDTSDSEYAQIFAS
jgi:hypothetical protein